MDREEYAMKSKCFCGICKESFNLLFKWKKIFFQITLALILPFSVIYLAYQQANSILFYRILSRNLDDISTGTSSYDEISHRIPNGWLWYWLIKIFYFTVVLVFSLLSTAAVTFTVDFAYARRDVAFRAVMSGVSKVRVTVLKYVPSCIIIKTFVGHCLSKVWTRLVITFICTFMALFLYNTAFVVFMIIWQNLLQHTSASIATLLLVSIVYSLGFIYLNVVWQLASVISTLEKYSGFKAMKKSQKLIKGKFWLGFFIFIVPGLAMAAIETGFLILVIDLDVAGVAGRVLLGLVFVVLNSAVILFSLLIDVVLYFVCKSYHNEAVDRPPVATHLNDLNGGPPTGEQTGDSNV